MTSEEGLEVKPCSSAFDKFLYQHLSASEDLLRFLVGGVALVSKSPTDQIQSHTIEQYHVQYEMDCTRHIFLEPQTFSDFQDSW